MNSRTTTRTMALAGAALLATLLAPSASTPTPRPMTHVRPLRAPS